jgi:hypothetical protein
MESRYFPLKVGPSGDQTAPEHIPLVQAQDIDKLGKQLSELSLTAESLSRQQSVLLSLNFEYRPLRHNCIPVAHNQTFDWAYRPEHLETQCHLLGWLRAGSGIFWVTGKPGSGKSTFMKYMADDGRTQRVLDGWAHPQTVLTASHYFWIAGTSMQKSQQGLLQELLMQIFRQQPELIESIVSERFLKPRSTNQPQPAWSTVELKRALQRVAESELGVKTCLFIDGLDEYSGDHYEFCQDLNHLVRSGNIKICVSSRPWNVFEDAFGGHPSKMLRIHDLTEPDIRAYVKSRLSEHVRWDNLHDQPASGARLISEVTQRAHGVFLWVFIVTKLLREGLTNDDGFVDLLKRLEQFPSDLEPFFKHMLDSVEPFYHHKMSGSLQIAVLSEMALRYPFYSYHEKEYDDKDYALKMKLRKPGFEQSGLTRLHHKVARRVGGHCKGLLEVGSSRVSLLHRTVADFLNTREMTDYLLTKGLPTFNAKLSLLRATLAFIKDVSWTILEGYKMDYPVGDSIINLHTHIKDAVVLASQLEEEPPALFPAVEDILDDLEHSLCKLNSTEQVIPPQGGQTGMEAAKAYFRASLIENSAVEFLKRKIAQEPDYLSEFDGSPLNSLNRPETPFLPRDKLNSTLEFLLEEGEDPNESHTHNLTNLESTRWTPWTILLSLVITKDGDVNYHYLPRLDSNTFLLYLKHGANPNARIFRSAQAGISGFSTAWIDFLLLSLRMKPEWAAESTYLQVLDAFLDGDINLRDPAFIPSSGETQFVHEAFFSGLKTHIQRSELSGGSDSDSEPSYLAIHPRQLRLWKAVTLKLLIKAHGCAWPMDRIWSIIGDVFGTKQQKLMQASYAASCPGNPIRIPKGANKRRADTSEEESTSKALRVE